MLKFGAVSKSLTRVPRVALQCNLLRTTVSMPQGLNSSFWRSTRHYSSGKNNKNSYNDQIPSFKWLAAITVVATGLFMIGIDKYGESRHLNEVSPEQLEELKKKAKGKAAAFSKDQVFVVFVLGGPGSGKGTQCANIVRDYDFTHLSAGDLLRAEQQREGSKYGQLIADYIKSGQIVPQEITVALLEQAIRENINKGCTHFLIDGFPRKMDQAHTFEDKVVSSQFTLFFECPEAVMLSRLLKRGETSGRTDDNAESIKQRFKVFVDQSMPVVEYFDFAGKVAKLRCDEKPETVYSHVQKVLKDHGVEPKQKK